MKKGSRTRKKITLKPVAFIIASLIFISSVTAIEIMVKTIGEENKDSSFPEHSFENQYFKTKSVPTEDGVWESFDSAAPGTPAEAHVTISDTTGLTIVVDFHGFWNKTVEIDETSYDHIDMPGTKSILDPGKPMLPRLSEYVEVPHGVDISLDVLATTSVVLSEYNVSPAPAMATPIVQFEQRPNITTGPTPQPIVFDIVFTQNNFFPAQIVSMEGGFKFLPIIMRGHRLLGVNFFPVQFNPVTGAMVAYSKMVIKVTYSIPAQIEPINESLWSEPFEAILNRHLLYYDKCHLQTHPLAGLPKIYTNPQLFAGKCAEYVIITTEPFDVQAQRLVEWKKQKGVLAEILRVPEGSDQEYIRDRIEYIYNHWDPVPTYVVLFGDVDIIPTNYDMIHQASDGSGNYYYDQDYGYIASDLGYFNIEGHDYFPDMIYSRISVDTMDQARTIVDKILQYEQSPPGESFFYNSILSLAYFEDKAGGSHDGLEDSEFPLCYTAERIRYYLERDYNYEVHYNYSAVYDPDFSAGAQPMNYFYEIEGSNYVYDFLPEDYDWFPAYEDFPSDFEDPKNAIIANLREGRFLVYYSGHGDSKNMVYWRDDDSDDIIDSVFRGTREGWHHPFFNSTNIPEIINGNMTPLILSIACNTGWFDGETDQNFMDLSAYPSNPYEDCDSECFAENITRVENGGALAVIASSRLSYSRIQGDLLDGIIQAFWPIYLAGETHPIYEMGAALLYGKLYAAKIWADHSRVEDVVRTTFEEYHLFGDPETQLWTGIPSQFNVSYPKSVGTSDSQRFVVTVKNMDTDAPVNFAKVCIQQQAGIYQVGYTNAAGQIIFDISPSDTPSHINVTVTKHNYKPHIGWMNVYSSDAKISLSKYVGVENEQIIITETGFPDDTPIWIFFDEQHVATIESYTDWAFGNVPSGPNDYFNVWAAVPNILLPTRLWQPVSVERFVRIPEDEGPDLYLYSQDDPWTWSVTGGEMVWDNPDITITRGGVEVSTVTQHESHDIHVVVHNKGSERADDATVTLSYARIGGGVSFTPIEARRHVEVELFEPTIVTFSWAPELPGAACLRVDLHEDDERSTNQINNKGMENVGIIEMGSPGTVSFQVANPNSTDYVLIKVKQEGHLDDIWNASILGHSTQAMIRYQNENVSIFIDPGFEIGEDDWRLYKIEIFVNCELIGGMIFNATLLPEEPPCSILVIVLITGGVILIAVVVYFTKKRV